MEKVPHLITVLDVIKLALLYVLSLVERMPV